MQKLSFEYEDSISITALTFIALNIKELDYFAKNLRLSDGITFLLAQNVKPDKDGIRTIRTPYEKELEAMVRLKDTRDKIRQAVKNEEIAIHEMDTMDCQEARLDYVSANAWLKITANIETPEGPVRERKDRQENRLLVIAALFDLLDKDASFATTAVKIEERLYNLLSLDESTRLKNQTIEKLLSKASDTLKNKLKNS